jgi:hypothetical protein
MNPENDPKKAKARVTMTELVIKLARSSGRMPSSLFVVVDRVSAQRVDGGGYGDIFTGVLQGQKVGMKRVRIAGDRESSLEVRASHRPFDRC